jgi:hypothetical protein
MTEYEKLVKLENEDINVEIRVNATKQEGVANSTAKGMVAVFYGNDDGSDDKIVSVEEFNRDYTVLGVVE